MYQYMFDTHYVSVDRYTYLAIYIKTIKYSYYIVSPTVNSSKQLTGPPDLTIRYEIVTPQSTQP